MLIKSVKRIVLIILLLNTFSGLRADEFIVKTFKKDPNNLNARKNQRMDDNDEACALILVRTGLSGIQFSSNTGTIGDIQFIDGEYWIYMSPGTRRLSFYKENFIKQDFDIDVRLNSYDVYILELSYKRTETTEIINSMGFILIESDPTGADVSIDGEATGMQTPFQRSLVEGFYRYTLKKDLYLDFEDDFTVIPGETIREYGILPANHGSIQIVSKPEAGASIVVDGKSYSDKTPATIHKLEAGEHTIVLRKNMFEPYEQAVTINAGQTGELIVNLKPTFGIVQISAGEGDEIFIDSEKAGDGNYIGRLLKGLHLIEIKRFNHHPQFKTIDIIPGDTSSFSVELNPKIGILSVMTEPHEAEIFIDNKYFGKSPKFINSLGIGSYLLKVVKDGYQLMEQQIEIAENQTFTFSERLVKKITSSTKPGLNKKKITITSEPPGATLYVDDEIKGVTPSTLTLSLENHNIKLQKSEFIDREINMVLNNENEELSFKLMSRDALPEMANVAGGIYTMGCTMEATSCSPDEMPVHSVRVKDYYIGKYEITQKQWLNVMGSLPEESTPCDNCPVTVVSWDEVQNFINKLNEMSGQTFRLPTEVEWEYAARGGISSKSYSYSGSNNLDETGWYWNNSNKELKPVGVKQPNELGIYDMSGNAWEWCSDWYNEEYYGNSFQNNPQGPKSGTQKVVRGGSITSSSNSCLVSSRSWNYPEESVANCGFRLVKD